MWISPANSRLWLGCAQKAVLISAHQKYPFLARQRYPMWCSSNQCNNNDHVFFLRSRLSFSYFRNRSRTFNSCSRWDHTHRLWYHYANITRKGDSCDRKLRVDLNLRWRLQSGYDKTCRRFDKSRQLDKIAWDCTAEQLISPLVHLSYHIGHFSVFYVFSDSRSTGSSNQHGPYKPSLIHHINQSNWVPHPRSIHLRQYMYTGHISIHCRSLDPDHSNLFDSPKSRRSSHSNEWYESFECSDAQLRD